MLAKQPVHTQFKETIRTTFLSRDLEVFMKEKFESTDETFKNIAWSCHGNALKILQHNYRIRIHKFLFNRLPTRNKESTFRHHLDQEMEDADHVVQCIAANRQQLRTEFIQELNEFLSKSHTPAPVRDAIFTGIHGWVHRMTKQKSTDKQDYPKTTEQTIRHQQAIGWHHFMRDQINTT